MKILVIGGAGYIGSHVSRALLDDNHEVSVFDNLSSGTRENLFPEETFIEADILDKKALHSTMAHGFDAVIHLAALKAAGESMVEPEKYAENNITGTINILNAMTSCNVTNIVFSSSAAVYGEPRYIPIDEKHPAEPINFYGFTKLDIEGFLKWYGQLRGLRYAALRYFNAAGYDPHGRITGLEKNPANLLPVIMEAAVGKRSELQVFGDDYETRDGTGIRDYIHVTDLAKAHLMALKHIAGGKDSFIVNLGSESGISVQEMLETARTVSGQPIPSRVVDRRPGDPGKLVSSAGQARELLGWKAEYSDVQTLVATTWKAYKNKFK